MTPDQARQLALALPSAVEQDHHGRPSFRVGGKIFATLGSPYADYAMVSLLPEQQELAMEAEPDSFKPAAGAWGRSGSTLVALASVSVRKRCWRAAGTPPPSWPG